VLRPGDRDLDLLERLERHRLEPGRERAHHRRAFLDRARHRAGVVHGRREREAALERNEPVGWLEADHAAACGRDADRAAGVRTERGVGEIRGESGG
jgi:hypothetical protein